MQYVEGIDVSHHQGQIDWRRVYGDGIRFAYCKATEGATFLSTAFLDNYLGAQRAGVIPGAYHWLRYTTSKPQEQAQTFFDAVPASAFDVTLPPCLDVEWSDHDGLTPEELVDITLQTLSAIETLFKRKPVIYTANPFWRYELGKTDRLANYPLWIARPSSTLKLPTFPEPWDNWTFWQHSHKGKVEGIRQKVDLNRFNGSLDDLKAFCAGAPTSPVQTNPTTYGYPDLDLASKARGEAVQRLQGLLLSHGYGPEGLVGRDGLPDGIAGRKTRQAYEHFRKRAGLSISEKVDEAGWMALVGFGL